jgi:hypothetical protein
LWRGQACRRRLRWDLRIAVDFLPDLGGDRSTLELGRLDEFVVGALARL